MFLSALVMVCIVLAVFYYPRVRRVLIIVLIAVSNYLSYAEEDNSLLTVTL